MNVLLAKLSPDLITFVIVAQGVIQFAIAVLLALAVKRDAERNLPRIGGSFLVSPRLWALIVFLTGGYTGALAYWALHYSVLRPRAPAGPRSIHLRMSIDTFYQRARHDRAFRQAQIEEARLQQKLALVSLGVLALAWAGYAVFTHVAQARWPDVNAGVFLVLCAALYAQARTRQAALRAMA